MTETGSGFGLRLTHFAHSEQVEPGRINLVQLIAPDIAVHVEEPVHASEAEPIDVRVQVEPVQVASQFPAAQV
jgi:hypothetical protein